MIFLVYHHPIIDRGAGHFASATTIGGLAAFASLVGLPAP
jgi:hypothetical protein